VNDGVRVSRELVAILASASTSAALPALLMSIEPGPVYASAVMHGYRASDGICVTQGWLRAP
jgi:hypothetical protein